MPPVPQKITVYPIPVKDEISINLPPGIYSTIRLLDVNGRNLANYIIPAGTTLFKQKVSVPAGIYFLYLSGNRKNTVQKILVNSN
jgi:hypothetical protein